MDINLQAPMIRDPDTGRHCLILGLHQNPQGLLSATVIEFHEGRPRTNAQREPYTVPLRKYPPRSYHLVAVNDRSGNKEYLSTYAMPHEQACTMLSKQTPRPWLRHIRILLEEVPA